MTLEIQTLLTNRDVEAPVVPDETLSGLGTVDSPLSAKKLWLTKTSAYTAASGEAIMADTGTVGAFTLTLPPTPSANDVVYFADYATTFDTANLTVAGNGANIEFSAANKVLTTAGQNGAFVYIDATAGWKLLD